MKCFLKILSFPSSHGSELDQALYALVETWVAQPTSKDVKIAKIVMGILFEASPDQANKLWLRGLSVEKISDSVTDRFNDLLANDRQWFFTYFTKQKYTKIRDFLASGDYVSASEVYRSIEKLPKLGHPDGVNETVVPPSKRSRVTVAPAPPLEVLSSAEVDDFFRGLPTLTVVTSPLGALPVPVVPPPGPSVEDASVAQFLAAHPQRSIASLGLTPDQALARLQQRQAEMMQLFF